MMRMATTLDNIAAVSDQLAKRTPREEVSRDILFHLYFQTTY